MTATLPDALTGELPFGRYWAFVPGGIDQLGTLAITTPDGPTTTYTVRGGPVPGRMSGQFELTNDVTGDTYYVTFARDVCSCRAGQCRGPLRPGPCKHLASLEALALALTENPSE